MKDNHNSFQADLRRCQQVHDSIDGTTKEFRQDEDLYWHGESGFTPIPKWCRFDIAEIIREAERYKQHRAGNVILGCWCVVRVTANKIEGRIGQVRFSVDLEPHTVPSAKADDVFRAVYLV